MPKMEDATVRKVAKWLKIASVVTGSLGTILTPILVMYIEYAPQVRKARGEAEAGYEAMVPAIVELQEIQKKRVDWSKRVDSDIKLISSAHRDMERRLMRCEIYMDMLGERRNLPKPPPEVRPGAGHSPVATTMSDLPDPSGPDVQQSEKPQYKLPAKIDGAQKKAAKRAELKCNPTDPLCGELE